MPVTRDIKSVLHELNSSGFISDDTLVLNTYRGSTESVLFEVFDGDKHLAVKITNAEDVARTTNFYTQYLNNELLPKLLYTAPDLTYFVYQFVPGTLYQRGFTFDELEQLIGKLINQYCPCQNLPFTLQTSASLFDRMYSHLNEVNSTCLEIVGQDYFPVVKNACIRLLQDFSGQTYLVHGDLGSHNAIEDKGKLQMIIDPEVAVGLPVLELLFATVSKPNDINIQDVYQLTQKLIDNSGFSKEDVSDLYLISVYIRMGRSAWYHSEDTEYYKNIFLGLQ